MSSDINILDKEYLQWVRDLGSRYRRTQIKAAVKVNQEIIRFYWELERDIAEMHAEERWGDKVIRSLAVDLQRQIPDAKGLSPRNIYYCKLFYKLYSQYVTIVPQVVAQLGNGIAQQSPTEGLRMSDKIVPQPVAQSDGNPTQQIVNQTISASKQNLPQLGEEFKERLFSVPWGHHRFIMDKCSDNPAKAVFYVQQTVENGWSRSMLLNFLDLLFYNLRLSCYVVVEVKIGKVSFADAGQLSGYVVACNHILRKEGRDNPTIGLMICKEKDSLVAQYAVEASNQPLGISEYDLAALYPEKVEGTIPTIEEIETKLANMDEGK